MRPLKPPSGSARATSDPAVAIPVQLLSFGLKFRAHTRNQCNQTKSFSNYTHVISYLFSKLTCSWILVVINVKLWPMAIILTYSLVTQSCNTGVGITKMPWQTCNRFLKSMAHTTSTCTVDPTPICLDYYSTLGFKV